jgi:hypothetical protein
MRPADRDAMLHDFVLRLDACPPHSREARAVYREAAAAGLLEELAGLLAEPAAADLRHADALEAEKRASQPLRAALLGRTT